MPLTDVAILQSMSEIIELTENTGSILVDKGVRCTRLKSRLVWTGIAVHFDAVVTVIAISCIIVAPQGADGLHSDTNPFRRACVSAVHLVRKGRLVAVPLTIGEGVWNRRTLAAVVALLAFAAVMQTPTEPGATADSTAWHYVISSRATHFTTLHKRPAST